MLLRKVAFNQRVVFLCSSIQKEGEQPNGICTHESKDFMDTKNGIRKWIGNIGHLVNPGSDR
jgi:hypothetical protein